MHVFPVNLSKDAIGRCSRQSIIYLADLPTLVVATFLIVIVCIAVTVSHPINYPRAVVVVVVLSMPTNRERTEDEEENVPDLAAIHPNAWTAFSGQVLFPRHHFLLRKVRTDDARELSRLFRRIIHVKSNSPTHLYDIPYHLRFSKLRSLRWW